jgi:hypothetical protein
MDNATNGHDQAEPEIRFGPLPNQVMPASWAEGMLSELFETDRPRFGRLMSSYITGIRAAKPGRKGAE